MPEKPNYDIIIVGGGLVGASLAVALAATPLRIAIIEAAPWFTDSSSRRPPSYDDRIIALNYASQRIFSGMGIWDFCVPEAVPIKHIHVSDRGKFGFANLYSKDFGLPALGYVISARFLGHALQKSLAVSSIDIIAPAQLSIVSNKNQAVEVQIIRNNQVETLQTRLLVAADGGQSKIRQQLGIITRETDYKQTAVIANVTLEYPHQNTAYERFTPSGPLALLPLHHNDCSLVWTCTRDNTAEIMGLNDKAFLKALQQRFGWRLGRFMQVGQRHSYPLKLVRIQEQIRPRVVIIGNAAHTLHPVGGQGFNLGLRDVASLAESVVEQLRVDEDVGCEAVLKRYVTWQQPDQQRVSTITNSLVQVFSNTFPPLVLARNFGLLFMDTLQPLKKRFVRQMAGLNGYSSRLLRGLPL